MLTACLWEMTSMENDWLDTARNIGFTVAVAIDPTTLTVCADVRAMCAEDRCHAYGKNWSCPPACGTLEECSRRIKQYTQGVLLQTVGALEDSFDYEGMMKLEQQHLAYFHKLSALMQGRCASALCLGSGGCRICPQCAYPAPCRFPAKAYSSMEAYGLFVSQVCQDNGVRYYYGENTLAYTACILFSDSHIRTSFAV